MAWTEQTSLDRIRERWDRRAELGITVAALGRKMDLTNITLQNSKRVCGAHIYVTVAGSGQLDALADNAEGSRSVRALSAFLREVNCVAELFEIPVVAAQGARVHLLNYRPIADKPILARDVVLLALVLQRMTASALNPELPNDESLSFRAGIDLGETVGTRGGTKGDSELLFLGSGANRGAKLLGTRKLVVSSRLFDELGDQLELTADEIEGEEAWALRTTDEQLANALEKFGFKWELETSRKRIAADLEKWPVDRCGVGGAKEKVYFGGLGRSKSKLIEAAALIVDIDGFSPYIESLEGDDEKQDAIVALDIMRHEFREVLINDYSGGVRVQYQGDNMVALIHMPGKDVAKVAERALDVAAALQASMQRTLPKIVDETKKFSVTVGVATGQILATQLGSYGRRDAMVIGGPVTKADRISSALTGTQVGFSASAYNVLPDHLRELFDGGWSPSAGAWVATNLPADKLALAKRAHDISPSDQAHHLRPSNGNGSRIGIGLGTGGSEVVRPVRPYAF